MTGPVLAGRAALASSDPALLAFALEVGPVGSVSVAGGRTAWTVGGPLAPSTRCVGAPQGIVAHQPEEMTVTVRAGTTVADLHEALAGAGQQTVLPEVPGATVGGVVAVGRDGPHRLGRGLLRDAVLQVRYVSAEGRLVTAGGPTVKNVTGFDLCRLLVGSLGTLGLLAEVILRTRPRAGAQQWLVGQADPSAVRRRLYRPSAILWDGGTMWVHLEGHPDDVAAERAVLRELGSFAPAEGPPELGPYRWSLAPAAALATVAAAPPAERWVVEVGVGVVHAPRPAEPKPAPASELVELHQRLKTAFDPTGRLNPGRDPLAVR